MTKNRVFHGFAKTVTSLLILTAFLMSTPLHSGAVEKNQSLTPVTLQLKWQHQFQFAGYYAAIEQGYYRDEGLIVTLKERRPGISVADEVSQGRAQFGVMNSEALIDFVRGKPIVMLGAIFQHSPNILLSRTDSNLNSPRDLRGKNVMYLGTTQAEIRAMLLMEDVNEAELKLQVLSWNVEDLIEGKTDAMSAYLTDQPFSMKKKGIPTNIMRPLSYGIDFYGDCLITSSRLAEEDPGLVERFSRASFKGWEYAMAHTDEIVALIRSKYNSKKSYPQLMFEAEAMRELIVPKLVQVGSMNPKRWQHIADVFSTVGLLEAAPSLEGFMYVSQQQRALQRLDRWGPYFYAVGVIIILAAIALVMFNRKLQKGIKVQTAELDRNRQNLRQVLDLVPSMVYAKNGEGRLLLVNQAVANSLGTTVTALTSQLHMDVHPDKKQAERMLADDQIVFDTGFPKVTLEEPYTHADGTVHWHQTTRLPYIPTDRVEAAVLVLSVDITSRRLAEEALKRSEEDLRHLNEELEDRVADRTRNLEEAKVKLEDSLIQLKQTQKELILSEKLAALGGLVAGVAHEINTPLGIGVTASSFLEDKLTDLSRKFDANELKRSDLEKFIRTGKESSNNILVNLNRAAELIKSFKQVAADQSSELPRQFNLKLYVDEVLLSLRPKYKRTRITILNECPSLEMFSYPGAFMQIITNLLVNSLTHAFEKNGEGIVTIGGRAQGSELVFTFSDNGEGIPVEFMDKVFEPFYTTKRGQGGTGLGLHIVFNTVTQTLGGTIRFESAPGMGTMYTITMPLTETGPDQI